MDLFVDGRNVQYAAEQTDTVDDMLDIIRKQNAERKRAIVSLVCDGIDVLGDELGDVLARPARDYDRVDVRTGPPDILVIPALTEALATLDAAQEDRAEAIALFGRGQTSDAVAQLGRCLERWHQVNEAIANALGLLDTLGDTLATDLERLLGFLDPVRDKLSQVKSAIQAHDYVTLTDILEYEFDPAIRGWRDALQGILDQSSADAVKRRAADADTP